jgi:hypothetical protein
MHKLFLASRICALLIFTIMLATAAQAQLDNTYVASSGFDTSDCSRTTPCRTFAGALAKTNTGGQINAVDPGDYGPVTINKSVIIDGKGTSASINVTSGNAISTTVPLNTSTIVLRNLQLNGAGTASRGVNQLSGTLIMQNVTITGFSTGYFVSGASAATPTRSEVSHCYFNDNTVGVEAQSHTIVALSNCYITGNIHKGGVPFGVNIQPGSSTTATVKIEFCEISYTHSAIRASASDIPGKGNVNVYIRSNHIFSNTFGINYSNNVDNFTDSMNRFSNNGDINATGTVNYDNFTIPVQ